MERYKSYKTIEKHSMEIEKLEFQLNEARQRYNQYLEIIKEKSQDPELNTSIKEIGKLNITKKQIDRFAAKINETKFIINILINQNQDFINLIEQKNFTIKNLPLPESWRPSDDEFVLALECKKCGYITNRTASQFRLIPTCRGCLNTKKLQGLKERRRKLHNDDIDILLQFYPKAKLVSEITGEKNELVTFICENGTQFTKHFENLKYSEKPCKMRSQWCGCPKCRSDKNANKIKKFMRENKGSFPGIEQAEVMYRRLKENSRRLGLTVISKAWIGMNTMHVFKCRVCGTHIYKTPFNMFYESPRILKIGYCTQICMDKVNKYKNLLQ